MKGKAFSEEVMALLDSVIDNEIPVWIVEQSLPAVGPIRLRPYSVPEWYENTIIIGEYVSGAADVGDLVYFVCRDDGSGWDMHRIAGVLELLDDLTYDLRRFTDKLFVAVDDVNV